MNGHLRAVMLDVDGTLVDSERDGHRAAFNQAFEEFGLPYRWDPHGYGDLLVTTGGQRRLRAYLEQQGVPEPHRSDLARRLHARKTELFQVMVEDGQIPPRPGVPDLLDELTAHGVPLAVVTTGSRAWVHPLLQKLFGLDRFSVVVTGDAVAVRKPDPSAHLLALEALGADAARNIVALEDSRNGLVAAKAAGLACVVVANDYTREQDFSEAELVLDGFGADKSPCVLHDPFQLAPKGRLDVQTLRSVAARGSPAHRVDP